MIDLLPSTSSLPDRYPHPVREALHYLSHASLTMDSPLLQSCSLPQRTRTSSNLSVHSYDGRGAIRKRSFERSRDRSVSVTQAERLHQLVLDQATQPDVCALTSTSGIEWITPEHSPQPQTLFSEPSIEPFPTWTVPTPPRSDSGGPSVSVDTNEESVTTSISSSTDFSFDPPVTSSDMR